MSGNLRAMLVAVGCAVACSLLFLACFERRPVERSLLDSIEAQTNPYYAAGEFLDRMGAETTFDRSGKAPSAGATWIIPTSRVQQNDASELREWLGRGGRLVLLGDRCGCDWEEITLFQEWGITAIQLESSVGQTYEVAVRERPTPLAIELSDPYRFEAPGLEAHWWVEDKHGALLLGFRIGDGEVILAANDHFVRNEAIADHDHAEFFWRLLGEGRSGEEVRWTVGKRTRQSSEPGLLAVLWERARPLMIAAGLLLLWWVWMRARRFGPIQPDPPPVRRRLLEHVEATGNFAWRHDRGASVLDAMRTRLVRECAIRHPGWRGLAEPERERQLAVLSKLPAATVARAMRDREVGDAESFRECVFHLERMRKAL